MGGSGEVEWWLSEMEWSRWIGIGQGEWVISEIEVDRNRTGGVGGIGDGGRVGGYE